MTANGSYSASWALATAGAVLLGCTSDADPGTAGAGPGAGGAASSTSVSASSGGQSGGGGPGGAGGGGSPVHVDPASYSIEQIRELQGDLMLWVPTLKPEYVDGVDPVTGIRQLSYQG